MTIEIRPITPSLGADIYGADLGSDSDFEAIRKAFVDYSVIAIHDLDLSPQEHLAFARRWGQVNVNRFFAPVPDYPEIAMVLKEPDHSYAIGEHWHTDHSYDQIPAMCSILFARETPNVGGDTIFSSMHNAYMALSDGFRSFLERLKAWHSSRHTFGASQADSEGHKTGRFGNTDAATQDALHPVVIRHPLSGREGALCESGFYNPHRRLDQRGVRAAAQSTLRSLRTRRLYLPRALATGHARHVGITGPRGTRPSTTIRASAGSCTASPSRAWRLKGCDRFGTIAERGTA